MIYYSVTEVGFVMMSPLLQGDIIIIVTGVEGDMVNWLPKKTMLPEAKPRVTLFSRGANSPCHPKQQSLFILLYRIPYMIFYRSICFLL